MAAAFRANVSKSIGSKHQWQTDCLIRPEIGRTPGLSSNLTLRPRNEPAIILTCLWYKIPSMGVKILVVDDDAIAGGLSRDLLLDAGFEAEVETDSLLAIDHIRQERYALVVLDILMPGLNGLTLCHMIKSDPQLKETTVVMVSGKSFESDKQRAREFGASLFIEKPYNVD